MPIEAPLALTVGLCAPSGWAGWDGRESGSIGGPGLTAECLHISQWSAVHRSTKSAVRASRGTAGAHRRFVLATVPDGQAVTVASQAPRPLWATKARGGGRSQAVGCGPEGWPIAVHRSTRSGVGANRGTAGAHRRFVCATVPDGQVGTGASQATRSLWATKARGGGRSRAVGCGPEGWPIAVHRSTRSAVRASRGTAGAHHRFVRATVPGRQARTGASMARSVARVSPRTACTDPWIAVHRSTRSGVRANRGTAGAHRRSVRVTWQPGPAPGQGSRSPSPSHAAKRSNSSATPPRSAASASTSQ